MKRKKYLFTEFLDSLGVKFIYSSSLKTYNEHPYKGTMYGLSSLLSQYNVANKGLQIAKQDLLQLESPFIAQVANDLVLVKSVDKDKVKYLWGSMLIVNTIEEFNDAWSGVVLLAEASQESIEPDYRRHKIKIFYNNTLKWLLFFCLGFLGWSGFVNVDAQLGVGRLVLLSLNLIGVYVCYLLFLKQLHIGSRYADKLCSLFKKSDCNNVLESSAAKLFGVIGWSEVGLGYFISNVLALLFVPQLLPYVVLINIAALPYSFWSVWYQWFKVGQWCPLCLAVQALFWCLFVVSLILGAITMPTFAVSEILLVASIYVVPFVLITLSNSFVTEFKKNRAIRDEFNSLKMKDDVFFGLLHKQTRYDVDVNTSSIRFGNPDAKMLVTILTNPHCNPCSFMHERVDVLLEKVFDDICIQYIFSSFNEELEESAKCLIGIYQSYPIDDVCAIYDRWYQGEKNNREVFYAKYNKGAFAESVMAEFANHNQWKADTKLQATPTILVNGYMLPDNYKIEELVYFTGLNC